MSEQYDALLDEHEDEATLNCGCRMFRPISDQGQPGAVGIKFCRTHERAEKYKDALYDCRGVLKSIEEQLQGKCLAVTLVLDKANAALMYTKPQP